MAGGDGKQKDKRGKPPNEEAAYKRQAEASGHGELQKWGQGCQSLVPYGQDGHHELDTSGLMTYWQNVVEKDRWPKHLMSFEVWCAITNYKKEETRGGEVFQHQMGLLMGYRDAKPGDAKDKAEERLKQYASNRSPDHLEAEMARVGVKATPMKGTRITRVDMGRALGQVDEQGVAGGRVLWALPSAIEPPDFWWDANKLLHGNWVESELKGADKSPDLEQEDHYLLPGKNQTLGMYVTEDELQKISTDLKSLGIKQPKPKPGELTYIHSYAHVSHHARPAALGGQRALPMQYGVPNAAVTGENGLYQGSSRNDGLDTNPSYGITGKIAWLYKAGVHFGGPFNKTMGSNGAFNGFIGAGHDTGWRQGGDNPELVGKKVADCWECGVNTANEDKCTWVGNTIAAIYGLYYYPDCEQYDWTIDNEGPGGRVYELRFRCPNPRYRPNEADKEWWEGSSGGGPPPLKVFEPLNKSNQTYLKMWWKIFSGQAQTQTHSGKKRPIVEEGLREQKPTFEYVGSGFSVPHTNRTRKWEEESGFTGIRTVSEWFYVARANTSKHSVLVGPFSSDSNWGMPVNKGSLTEVRTAEGLHKKSFDNVHWTQTDKGVLTFGWRIPAGLLLYPQE